MHLDDGKDQAGSGSCRQQVWSGCGPLLRHMSRVQEGLPDNGVGGGGGGEKESEEETGSREVGRGGGGDRDGGGRRAGGSWLGERDSDGERGKLERGE